MTRSMTFFIQCDDYLHDDEGYNFLHKFDVYFKDDEVSYFLHALFHRLIQHFKTPNSIVTSFYCYVHSHCQNEVSQSMAKMYDPLPVLGVARTVA